MLHPLGSVSNLDTAPSIRPASLLLLGLYTLPFLSAVDSAVVRTAKKKISAMESPKAEGLERDEKDLLGG